MAYRQVKSENNSSTMLASVRHDFSDAWASSLSSGKRSLSASLYMDLGEHGDCAGFAGTSTGAHACDRMGLNWMRSVYRKSDMACHLVCTPQIST